MALAAATTAAALIQGILLWHGVRQRVPLRWRVLAPSLLRVSVSAALMGLVVWRLRPWVSGGNTTNGATAVRLLSVIALAAIIHLATERLLRKWAPDKAE